MNQLAGNNFSLVDCNTVFDTDTCNAVNQIIRRLNAIQSPSFCYGFGSGSGSFSSSANIGARFSTSLRIIPITIQRAHPH